MTSSALEGLTAAVKGRVVGRGDSGYDEARALFNAMIDKHPAAIAYCVDDGTWHTIDSRERGPARRACGGHNGAGFASVATLVIDLSS
jgi:hypothetical protein